MENDKINQVAIKNQSTDGFSAVLGHFSSDESFVFTLQKAQKLASALYVITGFFSDSEPLKWKFRTLASNLLEANMSNRGQATNSDASVSNIRTIVLEISSLLVVAKQAGLVSDMNYSIMSKEFAQFADSLTTSPNFKETGTRELRSDFFTVDIQKPSAVFQPKIEQKEEVSFISDPVYQPVSHKDIPIPPTSSLLPEVSEVSPKIQTQDPQSASSKQFKDYGVVAVKKNSRQSVIIGLLKRKKEIMIKDISPLIHGCSEKTIQRELLSMVEAGILKKTGEKRWSRYSLAIEA
ncbi:MAG: seg [Parcubacteria group bacterium]|nr:seg [Parcubacteria group bacterium]